MLLTLAIFLPILGALLVALLPSSLPASVIKGVAVGVAFATFGVTMLITFGYRAGDAKDNALTRFAAERTALLASPMDPAMADAVKKAVENPSTAARAALAEKTKTGGQGTALLVYDQVVELDLILKDKERYDDPARKNSSTGAGAAAAHVQMVEFAPWIPLFRINYFVGVDGLSLPLVFLTGLLGPICLLYSWNIDKGVKGYFSLFLLLLGGLMGVFLALDFFLFYVFWEIVLLPMYFLIGIWGGPRRIYASIKFFIYTLVGSVLMLLAMIALYYLAEPHSFNMFTLQAVRGLGEATFRWWIFLALFIGFAIKVPVFPFHTWLPDAHVEAPTAVSVILAAVLLKMGGYGFFRLSFPLAPDVAVGSFTLLVGALGLINLVYGALVAMAQTDFKKLVAYSSVSHMGYVLLGLAAMTHAGVQGAAMQMFNHGASSAMMFLLVGVVYERAHHRDLNRFGGLALKMPLYASVAMVGFFASLGLPGLNGFISEALVFIGAWNKDSYLRSASVVGADYSWMIIVALAGIVFTAAYILWTVQRVFLGQPKDEQHHDFPDLNWREWVALTPLAIICIVIGVYPNLLLNTQDPTLTTLVETVRAAVPGSR